MKRGINFFYFNLCLLRLHAFTNNSQLTNNSNNNNKGPVGHYLYRGGGGWEKYRGGQGYLILAKREAYCYFFLA